MYLPGKLEKYIEILCLWFEAEYVGDPKIDKKLEALLRLINKKYPHNKNETLFRVHRFRESLPTIGKVVPITPYRSLMSWSVNKKPNKNIQIKPNTQHLVMFSKTDRYTSVDSILSFLNSLGDEYSPYLKRIKIYKKENERVVWSKKSFLVIPIKNIPEPVYVENPFKPKAVK